MSEVTVSLLIGVSSSLLAALLLRAPLRHLPFSKLLKYRRKLREQLQSMPFIYRDLDAEVLNDFVDISFEKLDINNLRVKPLPAPFQIDPDERLRRGRRTLFLGNAGIGKTTLQRYAILLLLSRSKDKRFVYPKERPIPVYVPLKMVDNSRPDPILRYIVDNNRLFSKGSRGQARLRRMSSQGKLFFFFDGYDEIAFSADNRNFVRDELQTLMFPEEYKLLERAAASDLLSVTDSLHYAMAHCRVWLSSRREFFVLNPIPGFGKIQQAGGPDEGSDEVRSSRRKAVRDAALNPPHAVELQGVGDNREKLVQKIFNKYRKRSAAFREFLSEEYFLDSVESSNDPNIRELSFNPLFLTIMCYVYTEKVLQEKSFDVEWNDKFDDLILACVDLLLHDLDAHKARDLPRAHKAGLLKRRNAYPEDKLIFLKFFSAQLYLRKRSVFTISYLREKVREFFESSESENAEQILRDMSNASRRRPDFAVQLIYCGVFIVVDKSETETFYDFPHRRFREVLASRFLAKPEEYARLLENVAGREFSEFLSIFRNETEFAAEQFHRETLEIVLHEALREGAEKSHLDMSRQFVSHIPQEFDMTLAIERFLKHALSIDEPIFLLSKDLFRLCHPTDEFMQHIRSSLQGSLDKALPVRLSLSFSLLRILNSALATEIVASRLPEHLGNSYLSATLIYQALQTQPAAVAGLMAEILTNQDSRRDLFYCLAVSDYSRSGLRGVFERLIPELTRAQYWELLIILLRYHKTGARAASTLGSKANSLANLPQYKDVLHRYRSLVEPELVEFAAAMIDESSTRDVIEICGQERQVFLPTLRTQSSLKSIYEKYVPRPLFLVMSDKVVDGVAERKELYRAVSKLLRSRQGDLAPLTEAVEQAVDSVIASAGIEASRLRDMPPAETSARKSRRTIGQLKTNLSALLIEVAAHSSADAIELLEISLESLEPPKVYSHFQ